MADKIKAYVCKYRGCGKSFTGLLAFYRLQTHQQTAHDL